MPGEEVQEVGAFESAVNDRGSDLVLLDQTIREIAKEVDSLEKERRNARSFKSQVSTRRVAALAKVGDLLLAKRRTMMMESLDVSSPAVRILVQFVMERVKETLIECQFDSEEVQRFMGALPAKMDGWEVEVQRRIQNVIFSAERGERALP